MYSDSGHSDSMERLSQASKDLGRSVIEKLSPCGEVEEHSIIEDLYSDTARAGIFYYLIDGTIAYEREGKVGFYYDNGDLLGLDHQYTEPDASSSKLSTEFYAKLRPYSYNDLQQLLADDNDAREAWTQYLVTHNALLSVLATLLGEENNSRQLGFLTYAPGEVIIQQGDPANEVYSIVEGAADVLVNDVKVGEVKEEEIFGDMSLFTKSPRTATVVATRSCMVLVVPQDQFLTLLKTHPQIGMNLIEHMAKKIVLLNEQATGSSNELE